ncbi:MAG: protein-glutamate O-methyltransferase CheR [Sphingomonadales bacterium]|nr:MAG: protein-glutamate O-methyltransferase CheR [Sphingomonadales bacterium]TNF02538.1 MAG: protein-glutamate O-methyltransferase CheR [Sphingomonadales bacterium]
MPELRLTPSMRILAGLLEIRTGQTLSENRFWRIETLLRPIVRSNRLRGLDDLVAAIQADPAGPLARAVVDALLNNETSFFRDEYLFRMVSHDLIPALMEEVRASGREKHLRLWCAGCSTGQEAYSLAMLFRDHQARWPGWKMQIVATDISNEAVERAREGLFSQIDVQRGLPIGSLLRWFQPEGDQWRIDGALREMIDFRVGNLFEDGGPLGRFDMIFCRNVLLYFSPGRKRELFHVLSRHCGEGGYLLLGAGETVIGHSNDFVASRRFRGAYERARPVSLGAGVRAAGQAGRGGRP